MRSGWPSCVLIFIKTSANILNKLQMMVNILKKRVLSTALHGEVTKMDESGDVKERN